MSVWGHANGVIMLDGFYFNDEDEKESLEEIKTNILGEVVEYGEDCMGSPVYMPCGSEGSLDYKIVECAGYLNIIICGNLRDYNDIFALEKWYKDVIDKLNNLKGFYVREHVFIAHIEYGSQIIIFNPHRHNTYEVEYEVIKNEYNGEKETYSVK